MPHEAKRKIALARQLRKAMTEPERLLWARLKSRTNGIVFKRQQAIGPYVLDFFCYRAQLAVEIDGGCMMLNAMLSGMRILQALALKPTGFRQRRFIEMPTLLLTGSG
jgi:very-short-patch-repair endonuclease